MATTMYTDWNEIVTGILFEIAYGVCDRWGSEKYEYLKEDEFWPDDAIAVRKCPRSVCLPNLLVLN